MDECLVQLNSLAGDGLHVVPKVLVEVNQNEVRRAHASWAGTKPMVHSTTTNNLCLLFEGFLSSVR